MPVAGKSSTGVLSFAACGSGGEVGSGSGSGSAAGGGASMEGIGSLSFVGDEISGVEDESDALVIVAASSATSSSRADKPAGAPLGPTD